MLTPVTGGGPKRPRATAWIAGDDISGVGSTIQSSGINIPLSDLPDLSDIPMIEVQFDHVRTAGTGDAKAWVSLRNLPIDTAIPDASSGGFFPHYSTGAVPAGSTPRSRRVLVKSHFLQAYQNTSADTIQIRVQGAGSAVDTEWQVTNIRARLIYQPLF